MGYRSDVSIMCEKKAFDMLRKAWVEHDFEPDKIAKNENDVYLVEWKWVKWYNSYDDVGAIEDVLSVISEPAYDEEEGYGYKKIDIGEDDAQDIDCNVRGCDIFDDIFYVTTIIETPDDFVTI